MSQQGIKGEPTALGSEGDSLIAVSKFIEDAFGSKNRGLQIPSKAAVRNGPGKI
jgi:hypothetical protein